MSKESRQGSFKKAISSDDAREKRSQIGIKLRKDKNEQKLNKKRNLMHYTEKSRSENRDVRFQAIQTIRKKISIGKVDFYLAQSPPIDEVIYSGLIPDLVKYLGFFDDPELQLEAAWTLTNIASVINQGAVPCFIKLLSSPSLQVREQAVWALGNISGDKVSCRNIVLQAGAVRPLIDQFSLVIRGKPQPSYELIKPILPLFAKILNENDKDLLIDTCWALSYLSDGEQDSIQRIMDLDVTPRLVELLNYNNFLVQTPAIRCIGNFISGSDEQTKATLKYGALDSLVKLLENPKGTIVNETCWTISNIAAGTEEQVNALINSGCLTTILYLMKRSTAEIKKETAWTIFNITSSCRFDIVNYLVGFDVIHNLIDLLQISDIELKEVTLKSLGNILRVGYNVQTARGLPTNPFSDKIIECNGDEILQDLQDHPDEGISFRVRNLIQFYFNCEEVDEGEN